MSPSIAGRAACLFALVSCGYGKPACTVIDAMHNACAVVRYLGPDGKVREVKLEPQDLAAMAEKKRVEKP